MFKISLDPQADAPLSQQFYEEMRRLILTGKLKPGDRIPSSRELSQSLDISRPTISAGVRQLAAEGYLESRHGSGCFVSEQICASKAARPAAERNRKRVLPLSDYAIYLNDFAEPQPPAAESEISFYCWRPALDQFPQAGWARMVGRYARSADVAALDTCWDPQGDRALRAAIADLVLRYRGLKCSPDQIVLVMGLNQGLNLVSRLHVRRGGLTLVEDPSYPLAWESFRSCGGEVMPIAVDSQGLRTDELPGSRLKTPAVVYVTPSCQFPTGAVMPLARRMQLLDWARDRHALVLEDDYDSEYQDRGKPVPALMSLDKNNSVIYMGTLNQLMFPGLGLGYLILPPSLVPLYRRARLLAGDHLPVQLQSAVAEFIAGGELDRHVKRLRGLYRQRRHALVRALKLRFGERVSMQRDRAGVFVLVRFQSRLNSSTIVSRAAAAGVGLTSTKDFYLGKPHRNEFILGFGSLSEKQIVEGVRRLSLALPD